MQNAQQVIFKPSAEELAKLIEDLANRVGEYIRLEDEKKAANDDFNERMGELWDEIRALRVRIKEGE